MNLHFSFLEQNAGTKRIDLESSFLFNTFAANFQYEVSLPMTAITC